MISADDLVALIQNYNPKTNAALIHAAFEYGERMHEGQFRHSGEPYFTHPVAVAAILTEQHLDDATIITALLHDTIEDTKSTYADVARLFGTEVAELVDGVTKLTNLQLDNVHNKQAENFRKLFFAMSKDMRVILVKLADRLHNMRTIKSMRPEKQVQKARETMDIFAPLAGRMGMQWMREELEDLAFKTINPEARNSILRRFTTIKKDSGDVISSITGDMQSELEKAGIVAEVYGRAKRPYSIWRKMQEKQLAFSRLSDIYGFRIITNDELTCYGALGVIHHRWRAVPGRFKDYISQPKSNGYRSLHTTVSGRDGKRVEVQIRTRQMHDVAESGVAAHWSYRDGERANNPFAVDPVKWIASLTEQFSHDGDHEDFLEAVKLEMYADKVFCFSPKGDVVKLPRGATPLDFAYAIHTRIGSACVGAKVDGMRAPMWTRLRNGQSVEIITAQGQAPKSQWLDMVATGKAKNAIRRALREAQRERSIELGRELVRVAFEHIGRKATEKALETAAKHLRIESSLELLARIGDADLPASVAVRAVYPNLVQKDQPEVDKTRAVAGLSPGQKIQRACCCQPIPGERIMGIALRGKGVVVHSIDCAALEKYDDMLDAWVDLSWHNGVHPAVYTVTLDITIANGSGVLGHICTLIGEQKANISDMEFIDRKPDFYRLYVNVDLRDVEHLVSVIATLQAQTDVAHVKRLRDPAKSDEVMPQL